jgi:hypothetical protein
VDPARTLLLTLLLALGLVALAQAEPLDRTQVAAGAKWLAHIDFDAARAAKVAPRVYDQWLSHGLANRALEDVRETIGMNLLDDVRGITFYGVRFQPFSGVVIVRANVNEPRLLELLRANASHRVEAFGDHELHTWVQEVDATHKSTVTGCFYRANLVVVGRDADEVRSALGVLDGEAPRLAGSGSALDREAAKGTVFQGGVIGLADLAGEHLPFVSPIIHHAESLSLDLGEDGGDVVVRARLVTPTPEVAGRVRDVLSGFRGMTALERDADQYILDALDALKIAADARTVAIDWRMPGVEVMRLVEKEWAKQRKAN